MGEAAQDTFSIYFGRCLNLRFNIKIKLETWGPQILRKRVVQWKVNVEIKQVNKPQIHKPEKGATVVKTVHQIHIR